MFYPGSLEHADRAVQGLPSLWHGKLSRRQTLPAIRNLRRHLFGYKERVHQPAHGVIPSPGRPRAVLVLCPQALERDHWCSGARGASLWRGKEPLPWKGCPSSCWKLPLP